MEIIYLLFIVLMFAQSLFNMYLNFYVWEDPERLIKTKSPDKFVKPKLKFSILIPARHEEEVIASTIRSIASISYPKNLFELIIVCESKDYGTIEKAQNTIDGIKNVSAKVVTFSDGPVNKPHGLNKALEVARNDVVVVFDAEDEVSPEILNIANTVFLQKNVDILQAGVQLMNYSSHWFAAHNVLEYYFWFKSRMHFHSKVGMVPLGGNTVFIKTKLLKAVGGWNENCLTEDAELGIRLSSLGAKIVSTYDSRHITKEETPATVSAFIKQRTRWNQGFIQVLKLGNWRQYNSSLIKALCIYTLAFPIIQSALLIITPFVFLFGFFGNLPLGLGLLSFIPILMILMQIILSLVALREFIIEQNLRHSFYIYALVVITFVPYQLLLGIGASRASYRELRGQNNWEKTTHFGVHRENIFNPSI